jgi:hypothetical protein
MSVCPQCNKPIEADSAFCESCGAVIEPAGKAAGPQQPEGSDKICPQCRSPNKPDAVFCESCGASLPEAGRVPPAPFPPGPAPTMKKAVFVLPDGKEVQLDRLPKAIGRQDVATYVGSENERNQLSRVQFTVYTEPIAGGTRFQIEDAMTSVQPRASTNHTWLISDGKEQEITDKGKFELKDGDEVSFAHIVKVRFKEKP